MSYLFSSEKCDFRLDANFAANSFTIIGSADNHIQMMSLLPNAQVQLNSEKCDWSVNTVEARFQAAVQATDSNWLVRAISPGLSGELGTFTRVDPDKCDWYVTANAAEPMATLNMRSRKCSGSAKCDWHLNANSINLGLAVDSEKCDWRVTSNSDNLNLVASNTSPSLTSTQVSLPPVIVSVTSNKNDWNVVQTPRVVS